MNLLNLIETLRRNLKSVLLGCYAVLVLVVAADAWRLLSGHGHAAAAEHATGFWAAFYHIAETVPVFWTLFGFLGCVLLVVVSKTIGHVFVSKEENFYDE
ncbi:MAG: hypothetical protein HZA31_02475 [Opitutae bacterium]|nr:hypothetical protein [Opitutae bacterium]